MLIDKGLLKPCEKVATYWPEFAAQGKDTIQVRHVLSHTSSVAAWDTPITTDEIYDIPRATELLASQAPWWTPGTASGYHMISQGHLVGELIRRVTGIRVRDFIKREITGPLGADFHIGAREEDRARIAALIPPAMFAGPEDGSVVAKALRGSPIKAQDAVTTAFRETEMGAVNGFGNARSLVRALCAISLGGQFEGHRFISEETINLIFDEQASGMDMVLCVPMRFGTGFSLPSRDRPTAYIPQGRVCFWGGWGGSAVIMDLDRRMTMCYAINKMGEGLTGSPRTEAYVKTVYECLGVEV